VVLLTIPRPAAPDCCMPRSTAVPRKVMYDQICGNDLLYSTDEDLATGGDILVIV